MAFIFIIIIFDLTLN